MFTKSYLNTARKARVLFKAVDDMDSLENLLYLFDLFGASSTVQLQPKCSLLDNSDDTTYHNSAKHAIKKLKSPPHLSFH